MQAKVWGVGWGGRTSPLMPCIMPSVLIDVQGRPGTPQTFYSLPHVLFPAHSGASACARAHTHTHMYTHTRAYTHRHASIHPPQSKTAPILCSNVFPSVFFPAKASSGGEDGGQFHRSRHSQQRRFYGIKKELTHTQTTGSRNQDESRARLCSALTNTMGYLNMMPNCDGDRGFSYHLGVR